MRTIVLLLTICFPLQSPGQELPPLDEAFDQGVLVVDGNEACHRFRIYLAVTRAQQRRGLMFVREMDARTGMLFVYAEPAYLSMWMKNTYIPLDMLFVRADGTVASIARDTEPQSLASIGAEELVRFVLELNAGTTSSRGIVEGSRLFVDATEFLVE